MAAERHERKPWAWAWDVIRLHYWQRLSNRAIVHNFAAMTPSRCISRKYVANVISDFQSTGNPSFRTQEHCAFREESLARAQVDWICDLLLGDGTAKKPGEPNLFFAEIQERFERVCAAITCSLTVLAFAPCSFRRHCCCCGVVTGGTAL